MVVVDGMISYAYDQPGYALYVARSKDKVEEHIKNIETLLSTDRIRKWCPKLSNPKRSITTNQQSKWTSTFLKSDANFSIPVSYTHLTLPTKPMMCRSRWSPYH